MKWPWKENSKVPPRVRKKPGMAAKVSATILIFSLFMMISGYDSKQSFFQNVVGTVSDIVMLVKPAPETPNKKGKILVCKPAEARKLTINGVIHYSENQKLADENELMGYYDYS